jgi:pimeloyl-ACP methyl ester carboxylesterase
MDSTDPLSIAKHIKSRIGHIWEDVSDLIIRPPRCSYRPAALGPKLFRTSSRSRDCFERVDIQLENPRGMKLECSWYRPAEARTVAEYNSGTVQGSSEPAASAQASDPSGATAPLKHLPCVVYLHGNCGSRLDARDCLFLLDEGITVFALDLSGSGVSEGEFVSLGFFERQDLLAVVDYLHLSKRVSTIGLWGRSMGAVTAIMYAARDPTIAAIVCDSPFSSLKLLAKDLAIMHASWVPNAAVSHIVGKIRAQVLERALFDIEDLDTLKYASRCQVVPAFIFHGKDDDFVRYEHSQAVAEHYAGNCIHHVVEGDHNSVRRSDVRDVARAFLRLYLIDKPQAAAMSATPPPEPMASETKAMPEVARAPAESGLAEGSVSTTHAEASISASGSAMELSNSDVMLTDNDVNT